MRDLIHRQRSMWLAFVLSGCVTSASLASAEQIPISDYVLSAWTTKDGLPSDVIWSVTQDREGYLWLGTNGGVVRFDGVRFAPIEGAGGKALPKMPARTVYAARDGSVWIGFSESGGISRLTKDGVRNYTDADGLSRSTILAIIETGDGTVWAGSLRGLYKLSGDHWQRMTGSPGPPDARIDSLYIDRAGDLLIGSTTGVYRLRSGGNTFELLDSHNDVEPSFRGFGEDNQGRLWMSDPQVGFRRVGERRPAASFLDRGRGNRLLFDREGSMWVATMGEGMWRLGADSLGQREAVERTRVSGARTMFEDRDGNIWAGSGDGLVRLSKPRVTPVTNIGLIEAVEATSDGLVWAATADELLTFVPSRPDSKAQRRVLPGQRIRAMRSARDGSLWIVTRSAILHRSTSEQWYRPASTAVLDLVRAIVPDARGGLWLSDRDGRILRWHPQQVNAFNAVPELADTRANLIYSDREGRLWFASTAGRIGVLDRDNVRLYGPQDGLNSGSYLTFYEDSTSTIWLGAFDGLYRFSGGRFVRFNQANRFRGGVLAIAEDADRDLWLATASGIVSVARADLERSLTESDAVVHLNLFDAADGSAGMPISFGGSSLARASDGRLWFVTGRGLTWLQPDALKRPRTPAAVRIESIQVDDQLYSPTQGTPLPARTDRIEIDYTAIDLTTPLRTRFKYRLEGFDAEWIDAGTRRQALYTHLPPRAFRFHVTASTSDGTWSEAEAIWDFSISPRFYQTSWFGAMVGLTLVAATWAVWRLRIRRIRRQFALLLGERVRLSRELHDTLLQSLVGVALQFDGVASRLDPTSPARQQLIRIRKEIEGYIREARASIQNLRTPRLTTSDLPQALRECTERMAAAMDVAIVFAHHGTPQRSSSEADQQLQKICQEAVLNAVRHGRATRIEVDLHYDVGSITLRVTDNGSGFDPIATVAPEADGHYGLVSMRERAEQLGGRFTLNTSAASGTVVEAWVPSPA